MKFFLLVCLFLFPAGVRLAASEEPPIVIDVQATTFKVTGHDLPLSLLLEKTTSGDEALFARLVGMTADGTAGLAAFHHLKTLSGISAESQSIKEQPYPTDLMKTNRVNELFANSFEYKDCGNSLTTRLLAPQDFGGGSFGTFEIQSVRGDAMARWPVSLPDLAADGGMDLTQFARFSAVVPFRSADASHHLLSVTQIPDSPPEGPPGYYFSFGRAIPRLADQSKSQIVSPPLLRLHALSFQIGVAQGRELLRSRGTEGDSPLLESLLTAMTEGTAQLTHQVVVQVDPAKAQHQHHSGDPADPFGPGKKAVPSTPPAPESDPFSTGAFPDSNGESIREYRFPTEFTDELYPISFQSKNIGHSIIATVLEPEDPSSTRIFMVLEHIREPGLKTWPESADRSIPKVHQPIFCSTRISTVLQIRPSGVYCLGAITLPDYFSSGRQPGPVMEISLIQVGSVSGPGNAPPGPSQKELEYEVVSLTETDAAALLPLLTSPDRATAFLENAIQAGMAHSMALSLLPAPQGKEKAEMNAQVELPYPTRASWTKDRRLALEAYEFLTAGTSFGHQASDARQLSFRHDTAPYPLRITNETLEEAANGKGQVQNPPAMILEETVPLDTGAIRISNPERIKVPAGHPEEGRWQVSVIRRR